MTLTTLDKLEITQRLIKLLSIIRVINLPNDDKTKIALKLIISLMGRDKELMESIISNTYTKMFETELEIILADMELGK